MEGAALPQMTLGGPSVTKSGEDLEIATAENSPQLHNRFDMTKSTYKNQVTSSLT